MSIEKIYARAGTLEVRLARNLREIQSAQQLRYRVFYKELKAHPSLWNWLRQLDVDQYDQLSDHLIVVDVSNSMIVGTYRIITQEKVTTSKDFYTSQEFDIQKTIANHPNHRFMEVGRACIDINYRNKSTLNLLWRGLYQYVKEEKIDVLMGCAGLSGIDVSKHRQVLSYLYHYHLAPIEWQGQAYASNFIEMNLVEKKSLNIREIMKGLPPLVKGYLRLGAYIGNGAAIDQNFNTTDILIILPVNNIDEKYFDHYSRDN